MPKIRAFHLWQKISNFCCMSGGGNWKPFRVAQSMLMAAMVLWTWRFTCALFNTTRRATWVRILKPFWSRFWLKTFHELSCNWCGGNSNCFREEQLEWLEALSQFRRALFKATRPMNLWVAVFPYSIILSLNQLYAPRPAVEIWTVLGWSNLHQRRRSENSGVHFYGQHSVQQREYLFFSSIISVL